MKRSSRGYRNALSALLALLLYRVLALPAQAAAPANDNFAQAQVLAGLEGKVTGTNVDATMQAGEPGERRVASVWFRWTAPFSGFSTFTTYR